MNESVDDDAKAKILQAWSESDNAPGEYLKQLRELEQKTLKELATELGVGIKQVEALEQNDIEKLPAPIYVKSYIKRYCSCLGIKESDISKALADASKNVEPTLSRVSLRQSTNIRHIIIRGAGYVFLVLVVVLLVYAATSIINFGNLWESVSSSSTTVESEAMELSLPTTSDDSAPQ